MLSRQDTGFHRRDEFPVVPLVLVGVSGPKVSHGPVKGGAAAEIGGDGDPVARASVRPGQRPATDSAVDGEDGRVRLAGSTLHLAIPKLADVEIALAVV